MATTRIAQPTKDRVLRGLALYKEHSGEIEPQGHGVYTVPGCSGGSYTVDLDVFADEPVETCSCPDFARHHDTCKHIAFATVFRARSRAEARSSSRAHKHSPKAVQANLERLSA
jgi:hypothetical protein